MHGSGESHLLYIYQKVKVGEEGLGGRVWEKAWEKEGDDEDDEFDDEEGDEESYYAPSKEIQAGLNLLGKPWWTFVKGGGKQEKRKKKGGWKLEGVEGGRRVTRQTQSLQWDLKGEGKGKGGLEAMTLLCHQCVRKNKLSDLIFCCNCSKRLVVILLLLVLFLFLLLLLVLTFPQFLFPMPNI